jgi:hypothetical protein
VCVEVDCFFRANAFAKLDFWGKNFLSLYLRHLMIPPAGADVALLPAGLSNWAVG